MHSAHPQGLSPGRENPVILTTGSRHNREYATPFQFHFYNTMPAVYPKPLKNPLLAGPCPCPLGPVETTQNSWPGKRRCIFLFLQNWERHTTVPSHVLQRAH